MSLLKLVAKYVTEFSDIEFRGLTNPTLIGFLNIFENPPNAQRTDAPDRVGGPAASAPAKTLGNIISDVAGYSAGVSIPTGDIADPHADIKKVQDALRRNRENRSALAQQIRQTRAAIRKAISDRTRMQDILNRLPTRQTALDAEKRKLDEAKRQARKDAQRQMDNLPKSSATMDYFKQKMGEVSKELEKDLGRFEIDDLQAHLRAGKYLISGSQNYVPDRGPDEEISPDIIRPNIETTQGTKAEEKDLEEIKKWRERLQEFIDVTKGMPPKQVDKLFDPELPPGITRSIRKGFKVVDDIINLKAERSALRGLYKNAAKTFAEYLGKGKNEILVNLAKKLVQIDKSIGQASKKIWDNVRLMTKLDSRIASKTSQIGNLLSNLKNTASRRLLLGTERKALTGALRTLLSRSAASAAGLGNPVIDAQLLRVGLQLAIHVGTKHPVAAIIVAIIILIVAAIVAIIKVNEMASTRNSQVYLANARKEAQLEILKDNLRRNPILQAVTRGVTSAAAWVTNAAAMAISWSDTGDIDAARIAMFLGDRDHYLKHYGLMDIPGEEDEMVQVVSRDRIQDSLDAIRRRIISHVREDDLNMALGY